MIIFALDPGPKKSALVVWDGKEIDFAEILPNEYGRDESILNHLHQPGRIDPVLVIEQVKSYGMAVGDTIFETVFWSGRFAQAWQGKWSRMPRMDVKIHLCHQARAKDSNIRQALIDRFEPDLEPKKRPKGILKGLKADLWAAMALAVTYYDTRGILHSTSLNPPINHEAG